MSAKTKRVRRWDSLKSEQQARVTFADVFAYIGREEEDAVLWAVAEKKSDIRRELQTRPGYYASKPQYGRSGGGRGFGGRNWTGD